MDYSPEEIAWYPGDLLRRALQVANSLWDERVSPTTTPQQFAALKALYREPRIDQRSLGHLTSLDRSTMSNVAARLNARGLIHIERDSRDRRRSTLTITSKGLRVLQHLLPKIDVMTSRLVGSLDAKERTELTRLLLTVIRANEEYRPVPSRRSRRRLPR